MAVILVADDEEMVRTLVSLALNSTGHEVLTAANGLEAVALFRSFPKRISLIVTDIQMPLMDGHQVVRLARQTRPGIKIICMTGYTESFPECSRILIKPFSIPELRSCVEELLAER